MKYAIIDNGYVVKITHIDSYMSEVFAAKIPDSMDVYVGDGYSDGVFMRDGEPLLDRLGQAYKELGKANQDLEQAQQDLEQAQQDLADANETINQLRAQINEMGKTELAGTGTSEDPFELEEGMELVPNAYYTYNGVLYVYMGAEARASAEIMPTGDETVDFNNHWAVI